MHYKLRDNMLNYTLLWDIKLCTIKRYVILCIFSKLSDIAPIITVNLQDSKQFA